MRADAFADVPRGCSLLPYGCRKRCVVDMPLQRRFVQPCLFACGAAVAACVPTALPRCLTLLRRAPFLSEHNHLHAAFSRVVL